MSAKQRVSVYPDGHLNPHSSISTVRNPLRYFSPLPHTTPDEKKYTTTKNFTLEFVVPQSTSYLPTYYSVLYTQQYATRESDCANQHCKFMFNDAELLQCTTMSQNTALLITFNAVHDRDDKNRYLLTQGDPTSRPRTGSGWACQEQGSTAGGELECNALESS